MQNRTHRLLPVAITTVSSNALALIPQHCATLMTTELVVTGSLTGRNVLARHLEGSVWSVSSFDSFWVGILASILSMLLLIAATFLNFLWVCSDWNHLQSLISPEVLELFWICRAGDQTWVLAHYALQGAPRPFKQLLPHLQTTAGAHARAANTGPPNALVTKVRFVGKVLVLGKCFLHSHPGAPG